MNRRKFIGQSAIGAGAMLAFLQVPLDLSAVGLKNINTRLGFGRLR